MTLRIGLVGCGRVAAKHFESIREPFELVAVCDTDPAARDQASSRHDVPGYGSLEAMLNEMALDVVTLATPTGLHADQTIVSAKHGVHVITEKPMATRWTDAQRMVQACEAANRRLFTVKQHRFSAPVAALRRVIESGSLGRIYDVHLSVLWTRPQSYYDLAEWRGTWEMDGGALMNQAIHYVDLVRWIVGPVESVHAYTATLARRIEVEDTAAMAMRFRCGALGTVNVTMLTHPANFEASLTVIAEHGTVRLGGVACNRIDHWQVQDVPPPENPEPSQNLYGDGHGPFYRDVATALTQGHPGLIEGAEGMKSLELIVAAYRSAQEGRRLSLPLDL
ncbi:MAG: Gfo/Idh/MocA family oxidoreductase [bacterium]